MTRTYLKKRILAQGVGGVGFQTAGIRRYVEDLKPDPNTQIGPKDFFEIGSNQKELVVPVFRYFFASNVNGPKCMS